MLNPVPLTQSGIDETLGVGNRTIAQAGCMLTCLTMACNELQGSKFSVQQMNRMLIQANCFAHSGLLFEKALARLGLRQVNRKTASPIDVQMEVEANRAVLLGIDYRPGRSSGFSIADHFILACKFTNGGFDCVDPATGRWVRLDNKLSRQYKNNKGVDVQWQAVEMIVVGVAGQ